MRLIKSRMGRLDEILHVGVLDLPSTAHLLDDELGIHAHFNGCARIDVSTFMQASDETAVFGHVIGGLTYIIC